MRQWWLAAVLGLLCAACRTPPLTEPMPFQVVQKTDEYVLRAPDQHETPFAAILQEYNGFERGQPAMDLHPQMELRVENAYYEKGKRRTGLDGYLGTEVARYLVEARAMKLNSVTPMQHRPDWDRPVQDLVSKSLLHRHYFRFYLEILFNRKSGAHGPVLLAADSARALADLAKKLQSDPESVCNARTAKQCTVFPEACSVSVEIPITVNGQRQMITLGSLLMSITREPKSLKVRRLYRGRLTNVELDAADKFVLGLPLLPGDEIEWN